MKQAVNRDYLRKEALTMLADHTFKAEVMGGNLSEYLLKGYGTLNCSVRRIY